MPNLITQYTNGTFEGAIGTWGSEFGAASSAQVRDSVVFFEGANSVKFTTVLLNNASFFNGNASFLICRFPAMSGHPYEVTLRLKCDANIPDNCWFYITPFSFDETAEKIGFISPVKASLAKSGWVELKGNFTADTITGEVAFYVSVLFDSQQLNTGLSFDDETIRLFYENLSNLSVSELVPAGALVWVDAMTAEEKAIPDQPDIQFTGRRLYYVRNVFYIEVDGSRTVIDEPIKWDQVTVQVIFDEKTKMYRFEFSDKDVLLEFDNKAGRKILKTVYKAKGTNADARLLFGEFDQLTDTLTILYTGAVNFEDCHDGEKVFKCNIERQSFGEQFRTYFDTSVNIFKETTLAGIPRPALTLSELYLHPRLLTFKSESSYNPNVPVNRTLDPQDVSPTDDAISYVTIPPMKVSGSNIDGFQEPDPETGLLIYAGFTLPAGISKRTFSIQCGMSYKYHKTGSPQQPIAGFGIVKFSHITSGDPTTGAFIGLTNPVGYAQQDGILAGDYFVNGSFSGTIDLLADEALFLRATILNPVEGSPAVVYSNFQWTNTEGHYLIIQEQTVFEPSLIKAPRLHDIVNRQIEIITDKPNVLKSNLLGRVDLGYSVDGCAANHFGMDGKIVRNFIGRGYNLSTKDIYNSIDGLFCTGLSIERDDVGNEWVRFEEMKYFFRNVLLINLKVIKNTYDKYPASKYLFNELEFGFKKYPQNNQQDSIEDFHTIMNYVTPLKRVKNKLSVMIDAIISGYYIEYTRRESFKHNPTNAYETDNDNFIISAKASNATVVGASIIFDQANRLITIMRLIPIVGQDNLIIANSTGSVTNGTYNVISVDIPFSYDRVILKVGNTLATNGTGTGDATIVDVNSIPVTRFQAKRDEDFDTITGVSFPKSVYNIEHHLKRIKLRWAKVFQAGWAFLVTGNPFQIINGTTFINGRNNTTVRTKIKSSVACKFGDQLRLDRFDAGSESVNGMDAPIFDKDQIDFDAPLTWTSFNYIRYAFEGRNPDGRDYGYVQIVNPEGEIERGYVMSMKFDPNKQMCKFTLIKKYDG